MDAVDLNALAGRVKHLEDLEAIRSTWLDYCNRLDVGDMEGLGDVFTTDATLEMDGLAPSVDGAYQGRQSIIDDFYRRVGVASPSSGARFSTGHISTNMQIDLAGDSATTLAYFFEIVDDNLVLIGTYQHGVVRQADRWRFSFLRISVRYRARLESQAVGGQPLAPIVAKGVPSAT